MKMTISARVDKNFCIKHNNRSLIALNVNADKCKNNVDYLTPNGLDKDGNRYATIGEIYQIIFEEHWQAFQKSQAKSRQIDKTYLEYIKSKKYSPERQKNYAYTILNYYNNLSEPQKNELLAQIRMSDNGINLENEKIDLDKKLLSLSISNLEKNVGDNNLRQLWKKYNTQSEEFWQEYRIIQNKTKEDILSAEEEYERTRKRLYNLNYPVVYIFSFILHLCI